MSKTPSAGTPESSSSPWYVNVVPSASALAGPAGPVPGTPRPECRWPSYAGFGGEEPGTPGTRRRCQGQCAGWRRWARCRPCRVAPQWDPWTLLAGWRETLTRDSGAGWSGGSAGQSLQTAVPAAWAEAQAHWKL